VRYWLDDGSGLRPAHPTLWLEMEEVAEIIGGPLGLAPKVLQRSDCRLSFFQDDLPSSDDEGDSVGADLSGNEDNAT